MELASYVFEQPNAAVGDIYIFSFFICIFNENSSDFAHQLLSPILKQSEASKNVKIMGHDDQRSGILEAAKEVNSNCIQIKNSSFLMAFSQFFSS
jgi:hypothetical protein